MELDELARKINTSQIFALEKESYLTQYQKAKYEYCSTKLPSDQPSCSATTSKNNNGSWLDSYLNNTLKVDSNPPKYHSLQESEIPEENVQMKERNYQKEAENVKKVDASSDLVDDWDVDNDYGPDSIGDCYAEYHAYD